jgi:hypothetical protein
VELLESLVVALLDLLDALLPLSFDFGVIHTFLGLFLNTFQVFYLYVFFIDGHVELPYFYLMASLEVALI